MSSEANWLYRPLTANSALWEISIERLRFPETWLTKFAIKSDRKFLRHRGESVEPQALGENRNAVVKVNSGINLCV